MSEASQKLDELQRRLARLHYIDLLGIEKEIAKREPAGVVAWNRFLGIRKKIEVLKRQKLTSIELERIKESFINEAISIASQFGFSVSDLVSHEPELEFLRSWYNGAKDAAIVVVNRPWQDEEQERIFAAKMGTYLAEGARTKSYIEGFNAVYAAALGALKRYVEEMAIEIQDEPDISEQEVSRAQVVPKKQKRRLFHTDPPQIPPGEQTKVLYKPKQP